MSPDTPDGDLLVLVIDDSEPNRRLVCDVLGLGGVRTVCAGTGEDGIAIAVGRRPDVILMDIRLPDMDGIEVTSRLRGDARTARARIVALTALASSDDDPRLLTAGFDAVIAKPVDVRRLAGRVRALSAPGARERGVTTRPC